MLRYLTRKDFELLKKGETKTVMFYDKREAESDSWRRYLDSQGGTVCVQVREISELERAMLEGEKIQSSPYEAKGKDISVKALREQRGLNQSQIAKVLGITRGYVSRLEKDLKPSKKLQAQINKEFFT
jgi:DNA-directed RNA polymerase specialized sigma subunit